jgi:DNA-binding MarR family transcriptional regulator
MPAPGPTSIAQLALEVIPQAMQAIRLHMRAGREPALSVVQLRTLAFVRWHAQPSLSEAAEHVGLGRPAMSALVAGLVRARLLRSGESGSDRRRLALTVSARGAALLDRAEATALAFLDARFATLAPGDQAVVARAFALLRPLFAVAAHPQPRRPARRRKAPP